MLSKRLLGIVLACALLLCGCMTGEHSPEESPVLDTPDARAAFTREAMMFTEMLFAGLPCEGTVTENGVQYPVVAHEQYPTYQSLVDALNWYFDPALAGALKEAMPYAEVQGKPVKTRDTATAGAQFDKASVTADSAEGLTLTVPSSQGDLTVSITLKDGRISGYTGAGHPAGTAADTAYERFCLNAVYATYSYCLPLWEATLPLDRDAPSATTPEFFAIVPFEGYKDYATVRQVLLGWCNETVADKLLAESPYTVQNGVWGLSAYEEAGGDLPDTITAVWQGGKVIATLTDGTQTARFAVTFTGTLITAIEPYDGDVLTEAEALAIAVNAIKRADVVNGVIAHEHTYYTSGEEHPNLPAGTVVRIGDRDVTLKEEFYYAGNFYVENGMCLPTREDIALGLDAGLPVRSIADLYALVRCAYTENYMENNYIHQRLGGDEPKFLEYNGLMYSNGATGSFYGVDTDRLQFVSAQADRITVYGQRMTPAYTWEEIVIVRLGDKWLIDSVKDFREQPPTSISGTYNGKKVTLSVDVVTDLLYDKNAAEQLWFKGIGFYNGYALLTYNGTVGGEIFDSARYNAIDYSGRPVLKDGATLMSVFGEDGRTMAGFSDNAWDMVWINGQGEVLGKVEQTSQYISSHVIYSELHHTAPLPEELSDFLITDQLSPTTKRVYFDDRRLSCYLSDLNGNRLSQDVFAHIGVFENGVAPIFNDNGQMGLIGEDGTVIVQPTYRLDNSGFTYEERDRYPGGCDELFLRDGRIVAAYNGRHTIFKVTVEETTPETQADLLTEAQAKELFDGLWERVMLANELLHNGSAACYEPGYDGPPREEVELPEGTIVTYEGKEYVLLDSYLPLSHAGHSKEYAQYNTAESVHAVTRSIYTKECIERYNKLFRYVDIDGVMYGCAAQFIGLTNGGHYLSDNFRVLHQTVDELVVAKSVKLWEGNLDAYQIYDVAFRVVKEDGSWKFTEKIYDLDYEMNLYKQYTQQ